MPDPSETTTETTPPPEATIPPPAPAPPAAAGDPEAGKTVQLRHSDFKKIKDEAEEKGRRKAMQDLDAAAVQAGFQSATEAFQALADLKKKPAPQPTAPQQPTETTMTQQPPAPKTTKPPAPTADRVAAKEAQLADERQKLRKQWKNENRQRRAMEREKANLEAEIAIRGELYQFGVKEVDFVLHTMRAEMKRAADAATAAGQNPLEAVAKFDRKGYVDKLRGDRPYLFGETVTPATTGTNGATQAAGTPAPPPAGQPTVAAAQASTFDASKATPEQFRAELTRMGLNPNLA